MTTRKVALAVGAAIIIAALAAFPLAASGYHLALGISLMYFTVLATAWALFSGPTHYISLATAAFFGIGAYTTAILTDFLPWPLVLLAAAVVEMSNFKAVKSRSGLIVIHTQSAAPSSLMMAAPLPISMLVLVLASNRTDGVLVLVGADP